MYITDSLIAEFKNTLTRFATEYKLGVVFVPSAAGILVNFIRTPYPNLKYYIDWGKGEGVYEVLSSIITDVMAKCHLNPRNGGFRVDDNVFKALVDYSSISAAKKVVNSMFGANSNVVPPIKDVLFNNPATIVFWEDGTKTIVKAHNDEYDREKGLAMAIAKKALGNKGNYFNEFKKWTVIEY